jgi:flavin-dependent dehydrogenase
MKYDVLVIGGGPAGATASALLAGMGHRVVLLEKKKFPRYHVGESLMPFCYFTLERLGVVDKVREMGFTEKHSVQFATPDGRVSAPFYFFQHLDHPAATTWQVKREDFDTMLLRHAESMGVEVREQTAALDFLEQDGRVTGVRARNPDGHEEELGARVTIDASGRDALLLTKRSWRRRDPKLNKVAIWTLFKGAKRDPGLDEGATTIAYIDGKGWFWNIPMADDVVSSGVVADRDYLFRDTRDPAEIFTREINNNKWIEEHLAPGRQFGEYWVTGEYSYRSEHCADDGVVLAGDAFAFLDPVFSSGVFLALKSGELVADSVDAALRRGSVAAAEFADYGETLCRAIEVMRKMVYAFYDEGFSFGDLIKKHGGLRPQVTDCLIGDLVGKDYDELMAAMAEFAELPAPLPYGRAPVGV